MKHTFSAKNWRHVVSAAAFSALVPLSSVLGLSVARAQEKSVVPEAVPAFTALNQWVTTYAFVLPVPASVPQPQVQGWQLVAPAPKPFEPHPVIVGLPELPLTGTTLARVGQQWDGVLNYQGVHMSLLVLESSGRLVQKPLSAAVAVGERFKIRITPTFDAVTELDQVVGDTWRSQRTGQAYPAPGTSVAIKAGQTVDLPLGPSLFFVVDGRTPQERMVVSVRHPKALREAVSSQPNYRQDSVRGSSYLQLVPTGLQPKVEQVILVQ
jgi:hypothetical protein